MAEQSNNPERGIQKLPNPMVTGVQELAGPALPPSTLDWPPVEQDREFLWFVLGGTAGALCGAIQEGTDHVSRNVLLGAIIGAVLGIVGGHKAENWRAGRFESRLVIFWTIYWLAFWTMIPILLGVGLFLWVSLKAFVNGRTPPLAHAFTVLAPYAVAGAIFGAVGGTIKAFRFGLRIKLGKGRVHFVLRIKPRTEQPLETGITGEMKQSDDRIKS